MESIEVEFFENIFPFKKERHNDSGSKRKYEASSSEGQVGQGTEVEPRRSKRAKKATSFGPDFLTYMVEDEPQTFNEAMASSDAPYWKETVNSEMESIMQNQTWVLVNLPPGSKPIGCKWIFKRKLKADGTIENYKARLVDKGYRQKEGQDFFDTYSPVTRITSIRMLIAIAALHNLEIHQMDVKTAFLNGDLE